MCLAVPGKILSMEGEDFARTARVSFGGIVKQVSLAYAEAMRKLHSIQPAANEALEGVGVSVGEAGQEGFALQPGSFLAAGLGRGENCFDAAVFSDDDAATGFGPTSARSCGRLSYRGSFPIQARIAALTAAGCSGIRA